METGLIQRPQNLITRFELVFRVDFPTTRIMKWWSIHFAPNDVRERHTATTCTHITIYATFSFQEGIHRAHPDPGGSISYRQWPCHIPSHPHSPSPDPQQPFLTTPPPSKLLKRNCGGSSGKSKRSLCSLGGFIKAWHGHENRRRMTGGW